MTATERQWVAFLQACKARAIYANELRTNVAAVLNCRSWQEMTRDQVGTLIRIVNECTRKGDAAIHEIAGRYAEITGADSN